MLTEISNSHFGVVAQPSRLRVRTASRRSKRHGAGTPRELAAGRLRYVKIDTEGFDRAVAHSLRELLRDARPYVKSEIYRHMPDEERAAYYDDLRGLRYRIFKCDEHVARGRELARGDMGLWRHFDILAVPEELA